MVSFVDSRNSYYKNKLSTLFYNLRGYNSNLINRAVCKQHGQIDVIQDNYKLCKLFSISQGLYLNASNKQPGAYLIFQAWYRRLFEGGRLFKAKIWGHLFNNHVSMVGAYSGVGTYSRDALNRSITVYTWDLQIC